ncbi:MAG: hypothetical protein ACOC55_02530 [Candidatus Natronoplasma sp.]
MSGIIVLAGICGREWFGFTASVSSLVTSGLAPSEDVCSPLTLTV